jgi:hypothetical protein
MPHITPMGAECDGTHPKDFWRNSNENDMHVEKGKKKIKLDLERMMIRTRILKVYISPYNVEASLRRISHSRISIIRINALCTLRTPSRGEVAGSSLKLACANCRRNRVRRKKKSHVL